MSENLSVHERLLSRKQPQIVKWWFGVVPRLKPRCPVETRAQAELGGVTSFRKTNSAILVQNERGRHTAHAVLRSQLACGVRERLKTELVVSPEALDVLYLAGLQCDREHGPVLRNLVDRALLHAAHAAPTRPEIKQ